MQTRDSDGQSRLLSPVANEVNLMFIIDEDKKVKNGISKMLVYFNHIKSFQKGKLQLQVSERYFQCISRTKLEKAMDKAGFTWEIKMADKGFMLITVYK